MSSGRPKAFTIPSDEPERTSAIAINLKFEVKFVFDRLKLRQIKKMLKVYAGSEVADY